MYYIHAYVKYITVLLSYTYVSIFKIKIKEICQFYHKNGFHYYLS